MFVFNGYIKNGDEITGVDCLRNEIAQSGAHIIAFESNGYLYKSREYDEDKDGPLNEAYNYCEKCCFNKLLKNGQEVCILRCATSDNEQTNFMYYEGEIWEKEKITE